MHVYWHTLYISIALTKHVGKLKKKQMTHFVNVTVVQKVLNQFQKKKKKKKNIVS